MKTMLLMLALSAALLTGCDLFSQKVEVVEVKEPAKKPDTQVLAEPQRTEERPTSNGSAADAECIRRVKQEMAAAGEVCDQVMNGKKEVDDCYKAAGEEARKKFRNECHVPLAK